jgi:hypothetical protein
VSVCVCVCIYWGVLSRGKAMKPWRLLTFGLEVKNSFPLVLRLHGVVLTYQLCTYCFTRLENEKEIWAELHICSVLVFASNLVYIDTRQSCMQKAALPVFIVDVGQTFRRRFECTQADVRDTTSSNAVLRGCTQDVSEQRSYFAASTQFTVGILLRKQNLWKLWSTPVRRAGSSLSQMYT